MLYWRKSVDDVFKVKYEIQNTTLGFNNNWKKKFCAVHYVFLRTFKGNENWFENRAVQEIRGKITLFD